MRLISAVFGFLIKKLGLLIVIVLTGFLAMLLMQFLVPSVKDAVAERDRLEAVSRAQQELQVELQNLKQDAVERRDDLCPWWADVIEKPLPGNKCKDAQKAVDDAEAALKDSERRKAEADDEVARLEKSKESGVGWVVDQFVGSWKWLLAIAALVLFLPPFLRIVAYFVLMPLVTRLHNPIHLASGSDAANPTLRLGTAGRILPMQLAEGEVLRARSEHVRPVRGSIKGSLLYDWSAPFISFAAGLYGLSRITGDAEGTEATLATPDEPNAYLMRLDFQDHPGIVMRPRHVIGVLGGPELTTRWRWGIQSLATWQVRYVLFAGTGSLIVQGHGDIAATIPGDRATRMEQNLVMGFDSRLTVGVNRTEVFWPYLWGKTPLVDDEFIGSHPLLWQKSSTSGPGNPITNVLNSIFEGIGKVLGF